MRLRLSMVTVAVVLLAVWLVLRHRPAPGPNPYVLQVPATYLSVGQQFEPQVVSLAAEASAATEQITLTLWTSGGQRLASTQVALGAETTVRADPMALPREGSYLLRAESGQDAPQTIRLHALPEAGADVGGILPITALGLAPGVMNYLREHGFVLTPADLTHPMPPATRLLLVGQPSGDNLAAQYGWLWEQVAAGRAALLLQPPAPAAAAYWPLAPPLVTPAAGGCGGDAFAPPLTDGLGGGAGVRALLEPELKFDFSRDSTVALYHWNGYQIIARGQGYPDCHALVSYRLGDGWVSQTTLPLLQHFQDVRARIYLMNLIMASARRKHAAPASPGLAWVMRQRMKKLGGAGAADEGAVYYRAPPQAVESAPVLTAVASGGKPGACWPVARSERAGASFTLQLGRARAAHALTIQSPGAPAYRTEGTRDGRTWKAVKAAAVPAGEWRAFRMTTTTASGPWQLCRFEAQ